MLFFQMLDALFLTHGQDAEWLGSSTTLGIVHHIITQPFCWWVSSCSSLGSSRCWKELLQNVVGKAACSSLEIWQPSSSQQRPWIWLSLSWRELRRCCGFTTAAWWRQEICNMEFQCLNLWVGLRTTCYQVNHNKTDTTALTQNLN